MSLRDRINSDPKLQLGLGAVLLLLVVFVFMNKGGGESEAVSEEPTAASVGTTAESTATGTEGGEASLASLSENLKTRPLPHKVIAAYDANKTVAILFVHHNNVDDRMVKLYSNFLHRYVPDHYTKLQFKLFFVPIKKIARYAAVTLGMQVQRVPALVVLRRKKLSKGRPEASILYGYQAPADILFAIRDASYKGPSGSYHPG